MFYAVWKYTLFVYNREYLLTERLLDHNSFASTGIRTPNDVRNFGGACTANCAKSYQQLYY